RVSIRAGIAQQCEIALPQAGSGLRRAPGRGQAIGARRYAPAGGLDHEHRRAILRIQAVAAFAIGPRQRPAIGHDDPRDARFARTGNAVAIAIIENLPLPLRRAGCSGGQNQQRRDEASDHLHQYTWLIGMAHYAAAPRLPCEVVQAYDWPAMVSVAAMDAVEGTSG